MLIAMMHYHLNRGGVTQVIASHLRALETQPSQDGRWRVVVVHGGRSEAWPDRLRDVTSLDYSAHAVPGLGYDEQRRDSHDLAARLAAVLRQAGGSPQTALIHVHNHSLGKNPTLPGALAELAREGWPLLLQIHDFAEDFRPENYQRLGSGWSGGVAEAVSGVYMDAAHVHYAVLNQRDARILSAAGVEPARLHVLPNAAGDPGPLPPREPARREFARRFGLSAARGLLLYPVRGIRRKNLGEALLWAALAGDGWHLGLTLAPENPVERPSYDRWKSLAASLALPVTFEVGGECGLGHADNLAAADRMLTTSVAEGFGLVFLESWLAGKALVGRDLPEITADFRAAGLRLDCLHPRLNVPVEWIGVADWQREFEQTYLQTLACFGRRPPPAGELRRATDALIGDGLVDFGSLASHHQQQIVQQVAEQEDRRQRLRSLNEWLETALVRDEPSAEALAHNAAVVRETYSLAACGRRLSKAYCDVAASPRASGVKPLPHGEQILNEFLRPERFQPIRIEP